MNSFSIFRTGALAAAIASGPATPCLAQGAADVKLVSHRAVYDLQLVRSEGNRAPSDARGRIAFDFSGSACEGYVQNFRQFTELQSAEGPPRSSDMRSATFEDGDGRNFRFKVETEIDRKPSEASDGVAARSADGALSVSLTRPKAAKLDLDRDVSFPTEHMRRVVEAARQGRNFLAVKVFDGSETGEKVFDTSAVIGKPLTGPADDATAGVPELAGMTRWPVAISYFEENKKDSQPNYTLSFDLYDNGVSRALRLDYGDFVLAGKMVQIEMLPAKPCDK